MTLSPTPEQEIMQLQRQLEGERKWAAHHENRINDLLQENKKLQDGIEFAIDYLSSSDIGQVQMVVKALTKALEK